MKGAANSIPVTVTEIVEVTPLVKRFRFEAVGGAPLPTFSGGAHVIVEMEDGDLVRHNAYSLMSPPGERSHYTISVRRDEAGRGGSLHLHDRMRPGMQVRLSQPVNLFPVEQRARRHLLVAGGIGITPFLAMMHELAVGQKTFELHYANRSRPFAAYAEEIASRYGRRVHFYHEDEGETLPLERLLATQPLGTHLYVCGPSGMIDWVIATAEALGWPRENVHHERFLAPPSGKPFDIELAASGKTVHVRREQSMLEAIEAADVDAPYLCRGGVCGQCETRVLDYDGEMIHIDHYLTDEEKASGEKIMPCVSRFAGRRLVLER